MSIEKEIIQSRFRNEYHKGLVNFIFTSSWVEEKLKNIFETESITNQQYNILRILRGADQPVSTLQIRQRMLDKMSDTSRIVDRLEKKGLLTKVACAKDKRLVDVSINNNGRKLLERLEKMDPVIDALFGDLSDAEIKKLNRLLDKIRKSNV